MYGRHVQVQNVWVTSPGDSIVGINTNYGDTARFSGITIYDDADADIDICTKYKGVTSGEPTKIGTGADGTNCIYSPRTSLTSTDAARSGAPSRGPSRLPGRASSFMRRPP